MPYPGFEVARLRRTSEPPEALKGEKQVALNAPAPECRMDALAELGAWLVTARNQGGATILLCDDDLPRSGVNWHLNDLMEKGLVTHLALSGLAALYGWDLARNGRPTVAYRAGDATIPSCETIDTFLNRLSEAPAEMGLGEALGQSLAEEGCDDAATSFLAHAWRWGIPVTVHPIVGGHLWAVAPAIDPAALAERCRRDFLVLANSVENLEQGIVYQFGRPTGAVAAFGAALSLARNAAAPYGRTVSDFTAALLATSANDDPSPVDRSSECWRLSGNVSVTAYAAPDRRRWIEAAHRRSIPALRRAALQRAGWKVKDE